MTTPFLPPLILGSLLVSSCLTRAALDMASDNGFWRFQLSPRVVGEGWLVDSPAPGLLAFDGETFLAPRVELLASASAGDSWFFHLMTRWDRGFDPGVDEKGITRIDEAFLRWQPLGDPRLSLQFGKFATVFGGWPARHDFWDSPFLSPPLPYSRLLGISDDGNNDLGTLRARRNQADRKERWVPMVWGPNYGMGAAFFGALDRFDYALELKHSGLSSHPNAWDDTEDFFEYPSVTARLGWRPDAAWAIGVSASHGTYTSKHAVGSNSSQTTIGVDARWSSHQWVVQGEVLASRFDTAAGDLDALGWYLESRYKLSPQWWLAFRFGQQLTNEVATQAWERDTWRVETALGFRWSENSLLKLDYGYSGESGNQVQGEHRLGLGIGVRF